MTKAGGTGRPAAAIRASPVALPPNFAVSMPSISWIKWTRQGASTVDADAVDR
ncbi:hypothetical protein X551_03191 [Methylibium sp. T29]|nr:hypothetical protein X551_03191 [Methylibium sp. T29]